MKKTFKLFNPAAIRKSLTALAVALLFTPGVNAQQSCTLVSTMPINTGYDPIGLTTISVGSNDPYWYISYVSSACVSASGCLCSAPPSYPAIAISPLALSPFYWTNANSQWLSFYNGTGYTTDGSSDYHMVISRDFALCNADAITFDFDYAVDNYISQLDVDGTVYYTSAFNNSQSNWNAFSHMTFTTSALAAGSHTINFTVYNESTAMPFNAHGLNIVGTMSGTGNNIVGPTSPANCSCTPSCPCFDSSGCSLSGAYIGADPDGVAGCNFKLNAAYQLADPNCQFVGYSWQGGPIVASSSMTYAIPDGTNLTVTCVMYAYDPITGDTCKVTRIRTLVCDNNGVGTVYRQSHNQQATTGNTSAKGVQVYPNPTADMVTVSCDAGITSVDIIDINGRTVGAHSYDHVATTDISLSGLPAGTYLFKVNGSSSKVVIKTK